MRDVRQNDRRSVPGFTLVELVIVIAIMGVLATLAVSGFRRFLRTAREVEGESAVMEIKKLQEGFRIEFGTYADNLLAIGYDKTDQLAFYQVDVELGAPGSGIAYEATATPAPGYNLGIWTLTKRQNGTWNLARSEDL